MVQVSWIKDWDTVAKGFFRAAIDSGDLELFKKQLEEMSVEELLEN